MIEHSRLPIRGSNLHIAHIRAASISTSSSSKVPQRSGTSGGTKCSSSPSVAVTGFLAIAPDFVAMLPPNNPEPGKVSWNDLDENLQTLKTFDVDPSSPRGLYRC